MEVGLTQACGANKNRRKSHYLWTKDGGQVTGCGRSNVWIAEIRRSQRADSHFVLCDLKRVQQFPGDDHPFLRLADTQQTDMDSLMDWLRWFTHCTRGLTKPVANDNRALSPTSRAIARSYIS